MHAEWRFSLKVLVQALFFPLMFSRMRIETNAVPCVPGRAELDPAGLSSAPVSELLPPLLGGEDAAPELPAPVQAGAGLGRDGLPGPAGAAGVPAVGGVPLVFHAHVDGGRAAQLHAQQPAHTSGAAQLVPAAVSEAQWASTLSPPLPLWSV